MWHSRELPYDYLYVVVLFKWMYVSLHLFIWTVSFYFPIHAGSVFYVPGPLNFLEAARACKEKGSSLARVGQLYSSWKFLGLERCDGGWLDDGSVRFPIIIPKERCGGITHPGVHSFGFPKKSISLYGAYCYR